MPQPARRPRSSQTQAPEHANEHPAWPAAKDWANCARQMTGAFLIRPAASGQRQPPASETPAQRQPDQLEPSSPAGCRLQEAEGRRDGLVPPQGQDVAEARRLPESAFHRARDREQLSPLIAEQAGSVSIRANEQGQFDQQLRPDITRMSDRGSEPDPRG